MMRDIDLVILLCSIFLVSSCQKNEISKCVGLEISDDSSLLLSLAPRSNVDSCIYDLRSNYLDDEIIQKRFYFDGLVGWVKMDPKLSDFQVLFSLDAESGSQSTIEVLHRDWVGMVPERKISDKYIVEIDSIFEYKEEQFVKFTIKDFIMAFPDIGPMQAVLFFSNKRGFIGSYYFSSDDENEHLLNKAGDVLEEYFEYGEYRFWKHH